MRLGFVVLTLLTLTGLAGAQHYCRGRAVVSYPAYSYAPTYTPYVAKAVVYEEPVVLKVPVKYDYYTVNQGDYSKELLADAAAFRALTKMMDLMRNGPPQIPGDTGAGGGWRDDRQPLPPRSSLPPSAPGAPVPAALKTLNDARCVKCHNPSKPGRIDLTDLSRLGRQDRLEVWYQVSTEQMPKDGKLSDAELKLFFDYVGLRDVKK